MVHSRLFLLLQSRSLYHSAVVKCRYSTLCPHYCTAPLTLFKHFSFTNSLFPSNSPTVASEPRSKVGTINWCLTLLSAFVILLFKVLFIVSYITLFTVPRSKLKLTYRTPPHRTECPLVKLLLLPRLLGRSPHMLLTNLPSSVSETMGTVSTDSPHWWGGDWNFLTAL